VASSTGLTVRRSETREAADHVWADTVVLGSSAGRGWDGIVAAAGHTRSWRGEGVCFAGHHIGINTATGPHFIEKKVGRRTLKLTVPPGRISVIPADCSLMQHDLAPSRWGAIEVSVDKVVRVLGRPIPVHEVYGIADPKLAALVKLVVAEVLSPGASDPLYAEGLGIGIISRLASLFAGCELSSAQRGLDAVRMRTVVARIRDDVGARHTIGELAQLAGLSPAYFARAFKQQTGITPHTFVMRMRLESARARLARGVSIFDAATECGFSDQAHLSRLFKQRFGVTPGEFARGCRER
jgi:AraC family transcriptional regulator